MGREGLAKFLVAPKYAIITLKTFKYLFPILLTIFYHKIHKISLMESLFEYLLDWKIREEREKLEPM